MNLSKNLNNMYTKIKSLKIDEKLKSLIDFTLNHANSMMIISTFIEAIFIFIFYIFKVKLLILGIIIFFIPFFIFFSINTQIKDEEEAERFLSLFKTSLIFSTIILVNLVLSLIIPNNITVLQGHKQQTPFYLITIICDLITGFLIGYFVQQQYTKSFFENLMKLNLFSKLGIKIFDPVKKSGDVILCIDKDTKQPVIIPYKDRFLHMLIIGPTGSGKTSQIILPLLNQDMQNKEAGITVLEPKGDLAEKAYAMAQYYGRPALYFNPILDACPTFNPLYGKEEDVVENITTAFNMLDADSKDYFKNMNEQLLRNALKLLKRLKGNKATMIDVSTIVSNTNGEGRKMVMAFQKLSTPTEAIAKENMDIAGYFLSDYYEPKSKTYDNTSGIRSQIAKIISNKFLRKVLNPTNGKSDIDFDEHLENGGVICISTAQGKLRDLGKFLGYFIILNFQSSVFKREGNENTRRAHFLYIDEFQEYANPGFSQMLTQGRSYRVASHLATQDRANIGMGSGKDGKDFIQLVSANARNLVIFPGVNYDDAKYYSYEFGEITQHLETEGVTRQKFSPFYFTKPSSPSQNTRYEDKVVQRFTPADIKYKKFREITYAVIQNNTLETPGVGCISYIPKNLNDLLDIMIDENAALMTFGYNPNQCRNLNSHGQLYPEIDMDKILSQYENFMEEMKKNRNDDNYMNTNDQDKEKNNNEDEDEEMDSSYTPPIPNVDINPVVSQLNQEDLNIENDVDSQNTPNDSSIDEDDLI